MSSVLHKKKKSEIGKVTITISIRVTILILKKKKIYFIRISL